MSTQCTPVLPALGVPAPRQTRSTVCTQCKRQKQRCDRKVPCSNCLRRQIPHLCYSHLGRRSISGASSIDSVNISSPRQSVNHPHSSQSRAASILPTLPAQQNGEPNISSSHSNRLGHLWNSRGAPSYHGSSHFGHQVAADMIHVESPPLPLGLRGIHASSSRGNRSWETRRSDRGIYSYMWDMISCLPRRKVAVDALVQRFLVDLNPIYDSLHEESFRATYDAFWNRRWGDDDVTTVDLRWLALLFMVLAFGELLDCPPDCSSERQSESEEASVQYFWESRKALVIAPTFSGESPDLVRAGILISRYLLFLGRKNESWLTCSFAVRMAQGQGMHIDGESWHLPPKVLETRRRLWSTLYAFDRSVSLAIGRPYTINENHCMEMRIRNVWVDDDPPNQRMVGEEHSIDDPTPSMFYIYQQRLAAIMGRIHDDCFGLNPLSSSYNTYKKVLELDKILLDWTSTLPTYFRFDDPDCSMDQTRPYLGWQRIYLHSGFHFARVTLHRTFVFLESITDRFGYSRDACISSACADLKLKLQFHNSSMGERLRAGISSHNLFNSALVLGIIAVRDPGSPRTAAILRDLAAYCEKQNADPWTNEFVLAEVKVIELCIASARRTQRESNGAEPRNTNGSTSLIGTGRLEETLLHPSGFRPLPAPSDLRLQTTTSDGPGRMVACEDWLDSWFGPNRNFPEPMDYNLWEDLVGILEPRQNS
ncbi:fungal-specific transcription factor domain-containing protein [Xylariaceae sp. FL1019]|nr:fungal-specific transcription factor domain-containing protein [Xylariaceae sp. FL1019]